MTNLEALKAQCKLICNTCYVDTDAATLALVNAGLDPEATAMPQDVEILRAAIGIVRGWVETSRSENGISAATDLTAVRRNIAWWCSQGGLDASEFLGDDATTIDNGSDMW